MPAASSVAAAVNAARAPNRGHEVAGEGGEHARDADDAEEGPAAAGSRPPAAVTCSTAKVQYAALPRPIRTPLASSGTERRQIGLAPAVRGLLACSRRCGSILAA